MATFKSYTDLSQSKVLAEILPLESADMYYHKNTKGEIVEFPHFNAEYKSMVDRNINYNDDVLPCWSLASLLGVLPEYNLQRTDWGNKIEYKIVVTVNEDSYASKNYDNPVDACVAIIEKLHKLNLL